MLHHTLHHNRSEEESHTLLFSPKEPHISSKKYHIRDLTKKPCIIAKDPCLSAKEAISWEESATPWPKRLYFGKSAHLSKKANTQQEHRI